MEERPCRPWKVSLARSPGSAGVSVISLPSRRYLSPPLSEHGIEAYVQKAREVPLDLYETLTTRERQVLQLAAEGRTNTEIAAALFVSPRTVETHRAHLMRKLGLRTQADLIRYALRRGIIPLEP
jgi:two-component system, NarL family, response regulator NreC